MSTRLLILLLPAFVSLTEPAYSDIVPVVDDDYLIQRWMVDDGLPRNTITSITQTPDGFLWLGSFFSLIRFDGSEFKEFGMELSDSTYNVRHITSDESGDLYLAPRSQLLKKFTKGRFQNLSIKNAESYYDFHYVTKGPDGTIWAIDGEGVIYKVVGDELIRMVKLDENFIHDILFKLEVAQDGRIWFTRGEVYGYYRPGEKPRIWRYADGPVRISSSSDGTIWILTKDELRKLSGGISGESELVVTLPTANSWANNILIDSRDRIWIAANFNGLFLWENDELKRFETVQNRFWSMFEDKDGSIWIGEEGGGILRIHDKVIHIINAQDRATDPLVLSVHKSLFVPTSKGIFRVKDETNSQSIQEASQLVFATVWTVSDKDFWAGSSNGSLYHFDEGRVQEYLINSSNQPIRLLFMDSNKNLWAGGFDWGLIKLPYPYESVERVWSEDGNRQNITAMVELPTGQVYAGSRSGNIFCFDGEEIQEHGLETGLKGSSILSLLYTSTGHLLAGTSGHGLAVLDDGKFHHISTDQGLFDPVISQMVEDDFGFLWIGSARGIFRIALSDVENWLDDRTKNVISITYGKTHGLSNIEVISESQPGASRTSDGFVEFATNKGVVKLKPEYLESFNSQPHAVIDSVHIDNFKLKGNIPIRIRSGFQNVSFNYTAVSFFSPHSIKYRCSLVGYDNDWVYMGNERSVRYSRLPPGNYNFKISASDQNGNWSANYASIPFSVIPRWWETLWARGSFLILFTGLIGFIVRILMVRKMQMTLEQTKQEMMLERERSRISRDLHDDLGARLTEIAFMADLAPKNAESYSINKNSWSSIAKRARRAVVSLDETVWMIDPGKDLLEHFVAYVVQYTTEFCERSNLTCRLNIPESLPSEKLEGRARHHLFLAFKEALNNVVRHAEATLVKVAMSCESNKLILSVSDNGKGLKLGNAETGQRHGIGNMRNRMERIGGEFKIKSNPEDGTIITFTLNFN